MIDRPGILKISLLPAAVCLVGAGVATSLRSLSFGGGVLLGGALGIAPFVSWAWLMGNLQKRALLFGVLAGKLAVYGGSLYLLVTREIVSPFAVFLGISAVLFLYTIAMTVRLSVTKEATS